MNLQEFFQAQEIIPKMVSLLNIMFQNINTDGIEAPFQRFIKILIKSNKIVHEIFTLKFPVPFFIYQSL